MSSNNKTLNELFGLKILTIRHSLGLSQEKFAELVDMHRTYIGHIERAERNITLKNIDKIARKLNIDPMELFKFDDIL